MCFNVGNMDKMGSLELTLVCENTASSGGFLGEHGLAWVIKSKGRALLFDTGQGLTLQHNFEKMKFSFSRVDAILLSHGHYDHVGGLAQVLEENKKCPVYAHPDALAFKFGRLPSGDGKVLSIPLLTSKKERAEWEERFHPVTEPTEIIPGVFTTGQIPRVTPFEHTGNGPFYLDRNLQKTDPVTDDLSVYFETSKGVVVILGCAHAGVINILLHIESLTKKPIHAVYGGMHLVNAKLERIKRTIRELRLFGSPTLYPNHCTGMAAIQHLYYAFPGQVHAATAGMQWTFKVKS